MINLKNTILGTAVILAASLQLSAAATTLATSHGLDVESGIATISSRIGGTGTI